MVYFDLYWSFVYTSNKKTFF